MKPQSNTFVRRDERMLRSQRCIVVQETLEFLIHRERCTLEKLLVCLCGAMAAFHVAVDREELVIGECAKLLEDIL